MRRRSTYRRKKLEPEPEPPSPTPPPEPEPEPEPTPSDKDTFGIKKINATKQGGKEWHSTSFRINPREFGFVGDMYQKLDPVDKDIFWVLVGDSTAKISGDSNETMEVNGGSPRIYIEGPWTNTESTAYVKMAGTKVQYVHVGARSNHEIMDSNNRRCGFGRYVAKFDPARSSGPKTACDKEPLHDIHSPEFDAKSFSGFSSTKWFGMKLICRTISAKGHVKVEAWVDNTEGKDGGDWRLNSQWIDDGSSKYLIDGKQHFIDDCQSSSDPNCLLKQGGEAALNKPWLQTSRHCNWRIQNVDGLQFKWMSVREVDPL